MFLTDLFSHLCCDGHHEICGYGSPDIYLVNRLSCIVSQHKQFSASLTVPYHNKNAARKAVIEGFGAQAGKGHITKYVFNHVILNARGRARPVTLGL